MVLLGKQFRRVFERANAKVGVTGDNLLRFLEARLDNTVFSYGFCCLQEDKPDSWSAIAILPLTVFWLISLHTK